MTKTPSERMTEQRRAILEEIKTGRSHPTADEVYQRVRGRLPRISLGTIYRTLGWLEKAGLIRRLEVGPPRRRYDGDLAEHAHIRCTSCGRMDDAPPADHRLLDGFEAEVGGFKVTSFQLEYLGLCPGCR